MNHGANRVACYVMQIKTMIMMTTIMWRFAMCNNYDDNYVNNDVRSCVTIMMMMMMTMIVLHVMCDKL